jgi:signal transduction histidine kinase
MVSEEAVAPAHPPGGHRGWTSAPLLLFVALAIITVLVVALPALRFRLHTASLRLPLETTSVVVALLVASMAYLRYSVWGASSSLAISLAFVALAVSQLLFGIVIPPFKHVDGQQEMYFWTAGSLMAGGLLLWATTRSSLEEHTPDRTLYRFVVGALAVVIVLGLTDGLLAALSDRLPKLCTAAACDPTSTTSGVAGLTPVDLALGAAATVLYLWAAVRFSVIGQRREVPTAWFSPALVLATFCQIHYTLYPTVFTAEVSTGDALRLVFAVVLLVGLMWDVRARFEVERMRTKGLEAAYEAERARVSELEGLGDEREDARGALTHDLMNSVAVLRAYATTLDRRWPELDEDVRLEVVQWIERETGRLRELSEQTMTVMRIDSGSLPKPAVERLAVELIREAVDAVDELGGRLKVHVSAGAEHAYVRCDPVGLLQVLRNLLGNAERYSTPGTPVVLQLERSDHEVTFSIRDEGAGILPQNIPLLFDRFSRVPDQNGESRGPRSGSGLGLYICRRIVESHGGRIWVNSEVGRGSTFGFAIPRSEARD